MTTRLASVTNTQKTARILRRFSWTILVFAIVSFVLAARFGSGAVAMLSSDQSSFIKNTQSDDVNTIVTKNFAMNQSDATILFTSKRSNLQATNSAYRVAVGKALATIAHVTKVQSYYTTHQVAFVSTDKSQTFAMLSMTGSDDQKYQDLLNFQNSFSDAHVTALIGGTLVASHEATTQVEHDLKLAEAISLPILALILIFVFRGLIAAALPLLLGVFSIVGSLSLLRILAKFTNIDQYSVNIVTLLSLGLAVDYCLLMVGRFREELVLQDAVVPAVIRTIRTAGRTILFSGLTVIVSLLSLSFFPIILLKSISLGGASAVILTMISALVILPCLLVIIGRRINRFRLGLSEQDHTADRPNLWSRIAANVISRPLISIVGSVVIIGLLAWPLMSINFINQDYRALPAGTSAHKVAAAQTNNFGQGQAPAIVIVKVNNLASREGVASVLAAAQSIQKIDGVSRVTGLSSVQPNILAEQLYELLYGPQSMLIPQIATIKQQYLSGNMAELSVQYASGGPSDTTAQHIVKAIRALSPMGYSLQVGGEPAIEYDEIAAILQYLPYAVVTIVLAIAFFLGLLLRSILIPIQAIVINSFSLLASLGIVVWIFQQGHLTNITWMTQTGGLNVTTPLLIGAIAFGLSMDYAVLIYLANQLFLSKHWVQKTMRFYFRFRSFLETDRIFRIALLNLLIGVSPSDFGRG